MRVGVVMLALAMAIPVPDAKRAEPLTSLVEAERAFAASARVKGVRDAFLEFFDEDAIALVPEPSPARPRLLSRPAQPFSAFELAWEPRVGDVARSGDFGWLTGPTTSIDHTGPDPTPGYGSYLSVWRRGPDAPWRVHLDIGIGTPAPIAFTPGFTQLQLDARYAAPPDEAAALERMMDTDRRLNAAIAGQGAAKALEAAMSVDARLHRNGQQPASGRDASVAAMLPQQAQTVLASGAGAVAPSADLGYTFGTSRPVGSGKASPYVRIWARDAAGRWWLMLDLLGA